VNYINREHEIFMLLMDMTDQKNDYRSWFFVEVMPADENECHEWITENCKFDRVCDHSRGKYLFKDKEDAMFFILKYK
jgi:hypothetical protein